MKCLTILFLKFLLLSNFVMAETIPTKSKILKEADYCIKDSQSQVCKELISEIEKLQLEAFDQNRFKCQSSLLGLQSEIIQVYWGCKQKLLKLIFLIISQMREFP